VERGGLPAKSAERRTWRRPGTWLPDGIGATLVFFEVVLYVAVSLLLAATAVLVLTGTVSGTAHAVDQGRGAVEIAVLVLDRILLTLIVAELVHTLCGGARMTVTSHGAGALAPAAAALVSAVACVGIVLAFAGTAAAGVSVGVNDDAGKDSSLVQWFYPTMGSEGLQGDTLTLRWDEGSPTTVPDRAAVSQAIAAAKANGVTVELDLYPLHSQVFTDAAKCAPSSDPEGCGDTARIQQFAAWTAQVARMFPTVRQFFVMNECNQPLYVNPQWDTSGQNQSAEICGRALAAAYDALHTVKPANFVWGVGLSPRGNDDPNATSNSSTSPVSFLKDLGAWFKAFAEETGRTQPLMDGFDFHPYPVPQSLPFAAGYASPNNASVSNLPRIYQAFYDGFNGSPQRTIGQQAGGGLPVSVNEVGIQTASSGKPGYVGTEVSATAAGGVIGQYATESYQSSWYVQMLNLIACDPNVRLVNIYHLIDEPSLAGWQSGLYYVDRSAKASAGAVHDWIATTAGNCQGALHPWTPAGVPAGPPASTPTPSTGKGPRIVVAAGGRIRIFDAVTHALRRVLAPFGSSYTGPISVALGDVNGDGVPDLAVGKGPGGPPVAELLNGKTGKQIASYTPFARFFRGGILVALGDVNGDGKLDLIVGTGAGTAAQVKVFSGATRKPLVSFSPFAFRGGVSVAAGDVNGDGKADVIVGTGSGTASRVKVYSGATSAVLESLSPFASSFTGGVSVAAGDVNGDGKADVIVGTGPGTTSLVKVFKNATKTRLWSFPAFSPAFTGGVAVAVDDVNGDGQADLVLGAGTGGGAQVKVLDGKTHSLLGSFLGVPDSSAIAVGAG